MNPESLLNIVNNSGFPFQLRIEQEVNATSNRHRWYSVSREHYWANAEKGIFGFIDLIIQSDRHNRVNLYMVIECKRTKGGSWIFLRDRNDTSKSSITTANLLFVEYEEERDRKIEWIEGHFDPRSPEADFCVVFRQEKDRPMLERTSSTLLESIECLAEANPTITLASNNNTSMYVPVIVTNTKLITCDMSPSDVDIEKGVLEEGKGNFEEVPFIRFRKSFFTKNPTGKIPRDLREANLLNQRTVFVVHAASLTDFLAKWNKW